MVQGWIVLKNSRKRKAFPFLVHPREEKGTILKREKGKRRTTAREREEERKKSVERSLFQAWFVLSNIVIGLVVIRRQII